MKPVGLGAQAKKSTGTLIPHYGKCMAMSDDNNIKEILEKAHDVGMAELKTK